MASYIMTLFSRTLPTIETLTPWSVFETYHVPDPEYAMDISPNFFAFDFCV
jgi:hypothetical protein